MKRFSGKFTSLLLALLLLFTLFPAQVFAAENGEPGGDGFVNVYSLEYEADGFGVYFADQNGERVSFAPVSRSGGRRAPAVSLPTQYDARDDDLVTGVKYQSGAGICWSFATISAIETSAVKQGLADVGEIDLSESHLANFGINSLTTDASDPTYGDGQSATVNEIFDGGGNYFKASTALARGAGAANEADYPFDEDDFYVLLPESDRYVSAMHISDSSVLDYSGESVDELLPAVKQAILENGSVTVAYQSEDAYYNITTIDGVRSAAYYEGLTTSSNHMVAIVGWDDNYSVEHFKEGNRPEAPGAWLCKNSWSTSNRYTVDGYFYISYYESSLHEFNAITAAPADAFDGIYQYDGVGYKLYWPYTCEYSENAAPKIANVFTAQNDTFLTSVGYWTNVPGMRYILYVYTGLTDDADPTSGTLAAKLVGTETYAGYHTAAIQDPIRLDEGEKFSVCAYMFNGQKGVILTENTTGYGSQPGQTFYYNGNSWADTYSTPLTVSGTVYYMHNTSLKAMTTDIVAHEHVAGEVVYENELSGSCSQPGSHDAVTYCTVCGAEMSRTTVETAIDPDRHVHTRAVGETASTCVVPGYTAGVFCDDCEQYVSGHTEKPLAAHMWNAGETLETAYCNAGGSILYTCTVPGCGATETVSTDPNPALHSGGTRTEIENETAGTCSAAGSYDSVVYCLGCGAELSRTTVETQTDPTRHVHTHEVDATESTCIKHGYTAGVYCDDCGQYISGHEEKPFAEHTWSRGSITVKPTCISEGEMTFYCTVKSCGAVKTEVMASDPDAHEHLRTEGAVDATCGAEGFTGDRYCDDCGEKVSSGEVIPATGEHTWDDGVVTTAATTTAEGVKTFTCTVCGETMTEEIQKALAKIAVTAENVSTGIKLTWAQDENATGYYVYRKTASTSYKAIRKVSSNATVTYTDTSAEPGTKYTYCVKSYRGTERGTYTAKSITCLAAITPTLANGKTGMTLTWTKAEGADGYYVFRKTGTGSYTTLKKIADPDTLIYIDTTAVSGTQYTYSVRAYKSTTKGAYTAKTMTRLDPVTPTLTNTASGITVGWTKVTGATGYYVYRKEGTGSYSLVKKITSGVTVSYSDTAVKDNNGTKYTYYVRAYKSTTKSAYTAKATYRVTGVAISSLTNSASKTMTVKWAKNDKATGYEIQYATNSGFTSAKTVTVSGASTLSKAIASLTKGSTYYVRVRAYKTVSSVK
ncbi:MAG: fibronectin type III domain-containing protein, partial [Clostridia bacterium]|nr:fibronectin type III domain-containing protein [Clostridia bacterium]